MVKTQVYFQAEELEALHTAADHDSIYDEP